MLASRLKGGAKASSAPLELTYDQGVFGETGGLQIPSTADAGDLAVYMDVVRGVASYTFPPDGFEILSEFYVSAFSNAMISYKVLESSDIGQYAFGADKGQCAMIIFKPNVPITNASAGGAVSQWYGGGFSPMTIASGSQDAPVISLAYAYSNDVPTFSINTMTTLTSADNTRVLYDIYNTSPSDDTVYINSTGTEIILGGYLALS